MAQKIFQRLAKFIHNNPIKIIVFVLVLTIGLGIGFKNIQMNMGNDVFVNKNSDIYKDTKTYQKKFGGDASLHFSFR